MHTSSFLTPSSLALGDAALGPDCLTTTEPLKSLPAMFNAEGLEEIQAEATSADGTVGPNPNLSPNLSPNPNPNRRAKVRRHPPLPG